MRNGKLWCSLLLVLIGVEVHPTDCASSLIVYVWGAKNNAVLRTAVITFDDRDGVINELIVRDNCGIARPTKELLSKECTLYETVTLADRDRTTLIYEVDGRNRQGQIVLRVADETIDVHSDFLIGYRTLQFSSDGLSWTVYDGNEVSYTVSIQEFSIVVSSPTRSSHFNYDGDGNYLGTKMIASASERFSQVEVHADNHYIIEMPPYGDPGEFSHRIEVWTDKPSRGTLRSAAINSYLLPAGTFDFIFPFFAPTPQEVFEQAAAGE